MAKRVSPNVLVYTFAVLMILLRPYCAYQMSTSGSFDKDPDAITRLLQRLIKKKEKHSEDFDEATELIQCAENNITPPFIKVTLLRQRAAWLLSVLSFNMNRSGNNVFRLFISNNYLLRISRLRI